ncbi:MAG: low molecular weight phosphatase family protein [Pseudomonadota bacterium]
MSDWPGSVLFCCDHNSVRSPMAEGLMKRHAGKSVYVQSAGVKHERDIDGFSVAVCKELGVELASHKTRSFQELEELGDELDTYDLIVALSPTAFEKVKDLTKFGSTEVIYWETDDPTAAGGDNREDKLAAYRLVRDAIIANIETRFPS